MTQIARNDLYSFHTQKELELFFTDTFKRSLIRKVISENKKKFIPRNDTTFTINKLQFLKKCECELVRLAKKDLGHWPEID